MTLQALPEPAVAVDQLFVGDRTDGRVRRIQQRRRVPLREDQVVVGDGGRIAPVVAQMAGDQDSDELAADMLDVG